ncbi:hypothetical protein PM082_019725 [Marasmius tenuissimus]|nr:hypothetical protein PM082_019725 [Marasmius tenuissimus]
MLGGDGGFLDQREQVRRHNRMDAWAPYAALSGAGNGENNGGKERDEVEEFGNG